MTMRIASMNQGDTSGGRELGWKPTHIDIESSFTEFVRTFRGGKTIEETIGKVAPGILNADFFFPSDKVIAELKCLEKDAGDFEEYTRRFYASARHFGYSNEQSERFLIGIEETPDRVANRFRNMMRSPIKEVCKKAVKQIRSTKMLLNMPDARGLVVVANDNNYGLHQHEIMLAIAEYITDHGRGVVEGAVYLTPNVYHDDGSGDQIAKTFWVPTYNVVGEEKPSDEFVDFVNDLGRAWFDRIEESGDAALSRTEGEDITPILVSRPIKAFSRAAMGVSIDRRGIRKET